MPYQEREPPEGFLFPSLPPHCYSSSVACLFSNSRHQNRFAHILCLFSLSLPVCKSISCVALLNTGSNPFDRFDGECLQVCPVFFCLPRPSDNNSLPDTRTLLVVVVFVIFRREHPPCSRFVLKRSPSSPPTFPSFCRFSFLFLFLREFTGPYFFPADGEALGCPTLSALEFSINISWCFLVSLTSSGVRGALRFLLSSFSTVRAVD